MDEIPTLSETQVSNIFYESIVIEIEYPLLGKVKQTILKCRQCKTTIPTGFIDLHICNSYLN